MSCIANNIQNIAGDLQYQGWSPVTILEEYDTNIFVSKVVNWVGGVNRKPKTNLYVSKSGLVESPNDAEKITIDPKAEAADAKYIHFDNDEYDTVEDALNALLYTPLVINTFSGGSNNEIGSSISPILLTWDYNKNIISQSINQDIGNLNPELRNYGISTPVTSNTTYILTANDGVNTKTRSVSVNFYKRIFFGPAGNIPSSSSQVRGLPNSSLIINNNSSYNLLTGTQHKNFIIAIPIERTLVSVIDTNNANVDITSAFELINGSFPVQDAGGNNQSYKLYALEAAVPYTNNNTFNITIS